MHHRTIVSFSWSSLPSRMESVFCSGRLIPPAVKVAAVAAAEAEEDPINWKALPLRWGEMLLPGTSDWPNVPGTSRPIWLVKGADAWPKRVCAFVNDPGDNPVFWERFGNIGIVANLNKVEQTHFSIFLFKFPIKYAFVELFELIY